MLSSRTADLPTRLSPITSRSASLLLPGTFLKLRLMPERTSDSAGSSLLILTLLVIWMMLYISISLMMALSKLVFTLPMFRTLSSQSESTCYYQQNYRLPLLTSMSVAALPSIAKLEEEALLSTSSSVPRQCYLNRSAQTSAPSSQAKIDWLSVLSSRCLLTEESSRAGSASQSSSLPPSYPTIWLSKLLMKASCQRVLPFMTIMIWRVSSTTLSSSM